MTDLPLCFVLMPFGKKKLPASGHAFDFDRIYREAIHPAVIAAGLSPIRADEELIGGIIQKPMFERLMLCDYAIADLTTANANVCYELGIRHAVRPSTTLVLFAEGESIPFDVAFVRGLRYSLGKRRAFADADAQKLRQTITGRLLDLKRQQHTGVAPDSPIFQLLADYHPPDLKRLKTDVFRERVAYAEGIKEKLAVARSTEDRAAIAAIDASLPSIADAEAGVLIDLYLSYRAVSDWQAMVDLHARMPEILRRQVMVREQLGFAYNRLGRRDEATRVLEAVIAEHGPSSETYGLLGRVEKDRFIAARDRGNAALANGYLDRAIDAYRKGFEADWRDAYPGINLLTLLDVKGDAIALAERDRLVPLVRYAVDRRLQTTPDYWDLATRLEISVLGNDEVEAKTALVHALTCVRESWEPASTANNLGLILDARTARGEAVDWLEEIVGALRRAATPPST